MRSPGRVIAEALVGAALLYWGCLPQEAEDAAPPAAADGKLVVYTVNYPLAYLAKRIGDDHVQVEFPAPRGVDPAFWEPDAETIATYRDADLILLNGAGYARWVEDAGLPAAKLVDTGAGFRDRHLRETGGSARGDGLGGAHGRGGTAFTTWLDLTLAVRQAHEIRNAFASARPGQEEAFQRGLEKVERDLMNLDRQISLVTAGRSDVKLLGSRPVYQYLARRYGLRISSARLHPDVEPGAVAWGELRKMQLVQPARWMLWEREPLPETAARLQEMGIESIVYDPCANVPARGDLLSVMWDNLGGLERIYTAF